MTASFEVTDPMLKQALLTHFVHQIEARPERMDELLVSGVSGELIDHLRSRATLAELCRVAAISRPAFTVMFDDRALLICFEQTARFMRDEQIKEYLARNGASNERLANWFSLSRSDADALRSALAPARPSGRPRLPDVRVRDAIHSAWAEIPSGRLEREAYYELHQQFSDLSIDALYQVVHELDVTPSLVRYGSAHRAVTDDAAKART